MEIWKNIIGFEKCYQISNKGNIRSIERTLFDKNGRAVHYKGKVLKPIVNSKGYVRVVLKKDGKGQRWFVHRLVALHFVKNDNPAKNNVVNHLDSDITNNAASNLEWTTYLGNSQHAVNAGRMDRTEEWLAHLHKSQEKFYKAVAAFDIKTGEMKAVFKSINECKIYGYQPSCICDCCQGKRKTHKGLIWKYYSKGVE